MKGMASKMKLKDCILEILESNRGKFFSGEEIAERMNVSRAAVWKAIEDLRKSGVGISAVRNRGYMLGDNDNSLSTQGINAILGESKFEVHTQHTVTSTNTVLKELAKNGEKAGYVLVAQEQTAGKGRLGRKFYSPIDTGIYLSVILRPKMTIEDSLFITTSAAVAVSRAIEKISENKVVPQIKWVNDVFIDGKKVCGILTEASVDFETGGLEYAVLGIGINIFPPHGGFPEEIDKVATAVFKDKNAESNARNRLAAEVIKQLELLPENFTSAEILEEYKQRSMLIGKQVFAVCRDEKKPCTVLDIDNKARLIVKFENGDIKALSTGEVSIRL